MTLEFWERPETVQRFAGREPDHRLALLMHAYVRPSRTAVLDLGCAGGRNTVHLARAGFDVVAVDSSPAMVAETRRRLAPILGPEAAERRVRLGRMTDLGWASRGDFDLVVALGVFHTAPSEAAWRLALAETARVLAPGGILLAASFTPRTDPEGSGLTPVSGEPGVYAGFASGRAFLLEAPEQDRGFAAAGLRPLVPTTTVERATESGARVTANGLYLRT